MPVKMAVCWHPLSAQPTTHPTWPRDRYRTPHPTQPSTPSYWLCPAAITVNKSTLDLYSAHNFVLNVILPLTKVQTQYLWNMVYETGMTPWMSHFFKWTTHRPSTSIPSVSCCITCFIRTLKCWLHTNTLFNNASRVVYQNKLSKP